jgi:hypothetical protein
MAEVHGRRVEAKARRYTVLLNKEFLQRLRPTPFYSLELPALKHWN